MATEHKETATATIAVTEITTHEHHSFSMTGTIFQIGSSPKVLVPLDARLVPPLAATVRREGHSWFVIAEDYECVEYNRRTLNKTERCELAGSKAVLTISGSYTIEITFPKRKRSSVEAHVERFADEFANFSQKVHKLILNRSGSKIEAFNRAKEFTDENLRFVEDEIASASRELGIFNDESSKKYLAAYIAGRCVEDEILATLSNEGDGSETAGLIDDDHNYSRIVATSPQDEQQLSSLVGSLRAALLAEPSESNTESSFEKIERKFWQHWFKLIAERKILPEFQKFQNYIVLRYMKKTLKDVFFGYGPLEDLLRTPSISEIMVVNYKTIYVERAGKMMNSGRRFFSDKVTRNIMGRIVALVGRHLDANEPLVDARLRDGSRVNAIIEPIAVSGSTLTIRRFPIKRFNIDRLISLNSLTVSAAEFLKASVLARKNILVSGGTGTGKTTLLNCLCDFIPENDRIVTIEDVAELQVNKRHVVRLEARPANNEGKGAIPISRLVINALRMRPDRIIVGECRGPEALDMLQAMNTGHDGSLTTIHANSPRGVVLRLETLVQMGNAKTPIESIDQQIVSAIDLIVQIKRMRPKRRDDSEERKGDVRRVSKISEIVNIDPETGEVVLRDLFALENESDAESPLSPTGRLPSYMDELLDKGFIGLERFYHDGR